MKNFTFLNNIKKTSEATTAYLSGRWKVIKPLIMEWYTGPAKAKAITLTAAGCAAMISCGALGFHALTHHDKISDTAYAVSESDEFTTIPESTATDVPEEESTTLLEISTILEETSVIQETTTEPASFSVSDIIPVSKLDISTEDLSTDKEVLNRVQANTAPALSSPLGDIHSADAYTSSAGFTTGIDVSKYQGDINWSKVKEDGISFAIIKVAGRGYETGKLYYDSSYKTNLNGASAAGLKVGAYFFSQATSVQEAREEASLMIDALKGFHITYPVVFDWETANGYRTNTNISKSTMTDMADTFCSMLENAGYKAMVYANTFDFERFHAGDLTSRYSSWLARYPANYDGNGSRFKTGDGIPSLDYPYQIWQYSSTGRVNGISGDVDMNVSFIEFSGTSAPVVPISFELPVSEYITSVGTAIDILKDVKAYNCAGINSTASISCSITTTEGTSATLDNALKNPGKYIITYSLKDFTGYTGYKSVCMYIKAPPLITLNSTLLTISQSLSYEDIISLIEQNIEYAADFTGKDISAGVSITYPEGFYNEVYEETSEEESSLYPDSKTAAEMTSGDISTETSSSGMENETTSSAPESKETTTQPKTEETTFPEGPTVKKLIPGTYSVTYSVTDDYGLSSSVSADLVITEE